MTGTGQIVGRVARDPKRVDRWTLFHPDGTPSNWFARGETLEDVRVILTKQGLELRDDGTVVEKP